MEDKKRFCTIRIKRRISGDPGPPPFLKHGELAFSEVEGNLYYQTNSATETTFTSMSSVILSGDNTF